MGKDRGVKETWNFPVKRFSIFCILTIFIIVPKTQSQKNDLKDTIKYASCIAQKLPEWVNFWKQLNNNFDVNNFYLSSRKLLKYESRTSLDSVQASRTSDKLLCTFSPDSLKMADIYSYRYGLKVAPNDKPFIEGGEPDTQVKLIDLSKDSIYTFLNSGTPTEYQDACWYDSSTLIVTGCEEIHDLKACRPFYLVLNLAKSEVTFYKGNEFGELKARKYIYFKYKIATE